MSASPSSWLLVTALLLPACKEEDDTGDDGPTDPSGPSDPNDPPPDTWMVGEEGEMLRVNVEGDASTYPLDHAGDLDSITCHGSSTAWVVGQAAAVLLSRDAGETWNAVDLDLPATAHLRSVATAEASHEGSETLVIAGDAGVLLRSTDGGLSFASIEGPPIDWTSVATDALGELTFVTGVGGSLWRGEADSALVRVYATDGQTLHDVAVSHDGELVVAVGEAGLVLHSHDGGDRFDPLPPATELDLHAVKLASDHDTIIAVGEAGVIVRITTDATHVEELLAPDDALLDVHLHSDGLGQAVGTRGVVLITTDTGLTWDPVDTGHTADLHGVDDFHHAPHL